MEVRILGEYGLAYVREQLESARMVMSSPDGKPDPQHTPESSIATYLLELPTSEGVVWLLAPDGVPQERLQDFDSGWLNVESYDQTTGLRSEYERGWRGQRYFDDFILRYLAAEDRQLVFQDAAAHPNDSHFRDETLQGWFSCGYHVYWFAGSRSVDAVIDNVLHSGGYPTHVGVLSHASGLQLPERQLADLDVLRTLAATTDHILLGAYDMEEYVIWSRELPETPLA